MGKYDFRSMGLPVDSVTKSLKKNNFKIIFRPEDTTCECGVKLGEGQSVKINSVLDAAKSWEFRNSTRVIRLKFDKTLITEPQWTSSARFHAETNQSVVLLHCKGSLFLFRMLMPNFR